MMQLLILSILVAMTRSQFSVEPSVLDKIFNQPVGYPKVISIKLKEGVTSYVDGEGRKYVCVPQYPYDPNIRPEEMSDPNFTGCGVLQVRDGSTELCEQLVDSVCTMQMESIEPIKHNPSPTPPLQPDNKFKCGFISGVGVSSNISGVQSGQYSWVVTLLNSTDRSYFGVGALISPEVVVTTAHVACRFYPNSLIIRAGQWNTNSTDSYVQERNVNQIYILNEFNYSNLRHNIALILLEQPLVLTDHVNVICLPQQDEVFDRRTDCVANGWDRRNFRQQAQYPPILKKVHVDIIPYTRCSILLKRTRLGSIFKLHSSFICGRGWETRDICQNDSGAPLVCPTDNNRYKLTGLVSLGIGCGQTDIPSLYTNVAKYRNWIDRKMKSWGVDTSWYS